MRKRIGISEARGKLPELAKYLVEHPGEVVLIEHRDLEQKLVLTTESYVRALEETVSELQKRANTAWRLAGSIESDLSDEELAQAMAGLRAEQEQLWQKKLREFAS